MSEKPISPLRWRMIEDMPVRNFVEKTHAMGHCGHARGIFRIKFPRVYPFFVEMSSTITASKLPTTNALSDQIVHFLPRN